MSSERIDPNLIIPRPQTARIFGILHILFGLMVCFFTYVSGLMFLFAPVGTDLVKAWMGGLGDTIEREHGVQVRRLERLKELARNDEQRAKYDQRLASLKNSPRPNFRDIPMGTEALEDPTIRRYSALDLACNLPLNIFMIVGGVGLIQLREWGRKASWWSSAVKVGAMTVSTIYLLIVIAPIQSQMVLKQLEAQQKFQAGLMKGAPGGVSPFPTQMNGLFAASATASSLFGIGLAAAYPITALVVLRRPSIRAACWRPDSGPENEGPRS